jgi:glutaconate CoA-transferase subunit B
MVTENGNSYARPGEYGPQEMMAVAAARLVRDDEIALVGYGLPMIACTVAKYHHAGNLTIMTEAGIYDARPEHLPYCVADARFSYCNPWLGTPVELLVNMLQTRRVDLGVLGGAQLDRYGNLNSTCAGDYLKPDKRFEGSGGAADFAAMANRTLIIMLHEKRRFVEQVDYLTSPGWKCKKFPGGEMVFREELGMWGGPEAVISTLGIMKFDPKTHEMYLESYFDGLGVTAGEVKENTGFEMDVSQAVPCTPPTYEELRLLRQFDPEGVFVSRY